MKPDQGPGRKAQPPSSGDSPSANNHQGKPVSYQKVAWVQHLFDIIVGTILPVGIGIMFAWVIANSNTGTQSVFYFYGYTDFYSSLLMSVVYTVFGVVVVLFLNMLAGRLDLKMNRAVVSFLLSPVLFIVMVVFIQTLLLISFKTASIDLIYSILAFGSVYASAFLIFLISVDALSPRAKNIFVIFYGSVFGAIIGLNAPTAVVFLLLLALAVEDYVIVNTVKDQYVEASRVTADPYDYLRFKTKNVVVGVGDIIVFSVIGAHAFYFFPFPVFVISTVMLLLGILTLVYLSITKEEVLPGLFVPSMFSLIPWLIWILLV